MIKCATWHNTYNAMRTESLVTIDCNSIKPSRYQTRKTFARKEIDELANNIKEIGFIQNIKVFKLDSFEYELICGERRLRASKVLGLKKINCILTDKPDSTTLAGMVISENMQRQNVNPIEEANAYKIILELGSTQEQIATMVGKSRSHIAHFLSLLKLYPTVKAYIIDNRLSAGHGKALATLSPEEQIYFSKLAVKNNWTVRGIEKLIKKHKEEQNKKVFEDPDTQSFYNKLSEHFGQDVQQINNAGKTGIFIPFNSLDELDGIVDKFNLTK